MSTYNVNLTLENIRTITVMFLDIFIMWLVLYYAIRIVRASAKTMQIFKGILLVLIIDAFATFLGLKTVSYLTNIFINWGFLAIIIIFQPEIRSILERMGKTNIFSRMTTLTGNEKENLVDQIVTATMLLSKDQTGALISIEQSHTLEDFIATGTKLNSDVTAELLTSLFVTSTPLHDGAVIIQGDKIACASAYFPPTNLDLPSRYGARHRAAIGISEITDALTIVVSEETGAISITESGRIMTVNRKQLRDTLLRVICGEETEVTGRSGLNQESARDIIINDEISEEREKSIQEGKDEKVGQTGVLSRLALRRQEKKAEKIEVEEVVNAESITPAREENSDAGIHRLEEEASEIKLPRKKERPAPSYPQNSSSRRFEEERRLEREERERVEKRRADEEAARLAMRLAAEEEEQRRALEEKEKEQRETRRMSADEVKAAREAMKERLSRNAKPEPEPQPVPEPEPKKEEAPVILNDNMHQFDTTKLDLSRIMGMDDELNRTFEMLDSIDQKNSSKDKKEGGDR